MPKKLTLPEYDIDIASELIRRFIHNVEDRDMLVWRLDDGRTFGQIAQLIHAKYGVLYEEKTIRDRVHKGEEIVFRHYPG